MKSPSQIMGIFGTGRSGSSWIGSIIDSHPQVAYRFEPFHRLKHYPPIEQARRLLDSEQIKESDLSTVYRALLPAHPKIERAPFFPKEYGFSYGKSWLRTSALTFKVLNPLFKWLYTPNGQPPIVFKEVTMEPMMAKLLTHTLMPVVYLIRHPCAVVASTVKGQKQGVMFTGRHSILTKLLQKYGHEWSESYISQLENMNLLEKETLLWRIDVERGISAAKKHEKALIVIYETLCDDPLTVSKQVFDHFGLDFSTQTVDYLETLMGKEQSHNKGELGIKPYFSVIRNPASMKDKWKQNMSAEDRQRVLMLVQDSPAFQFCATLGKWN